MDIEMVKASTDRENWTDIPVLEWAQHLPQFFAFHLFPPYSIAERYANLGEANHGMSVFLVWAPFNLNLTEYENIRQYYLSEPTFHLRYVEPAIPLDSLIAWDIWLYSHEFNVPPKLHKDLRESYELARNALKNSVPTGNDKYDEMLNEACAKAAYQLCNFLDSYTSRSNGGAI